MSMASPVVALQKVEAKVLAEQMENETLFQAELGGSGNNHQFVNFPAI